MNEPNTVRSDAAHHAYSPDDSYTDNSKYFSEKSGPAWSQSEKEAALNKLNR